MHGNRFVGLIRRFAARNVIFLPDAFGHVRKREVIQRAAKVPARIAILQAASQNQIQRCAGDHAQLTEFRHRLRQKPPGNARAHAALDNPWRLGD